MNEDQPSGAAGANLLRNFRSLVILSDFMDRAGSGPGPDVAALLRWIEEYHDYFVNANVALNGREFHAFSGRSLTITGLDLLKSGAAVGAIDALCGKLGMAITLSVALRDVLEADAEQLGFLKRPGLSLVVDFSEADGVETDALALARDISALLVLGPAVTLVGDMGRLRESGIPRLAPFNDRFMSILAKTPDSAVRWFRKRWARNPCKEYLSLYIDHLGDVYPCAGLVGHAPARFGNIKMPFEALAIPLEQSRDSMTRLSAAGPTIPASTPFPTDLCRVHRESVHSLQTI